MSYSTPAIRSSFIGREDDLSSLEDSIARPTTRLLTITGPGGVGKTRLTNELIQQVRATLPGEIWFVPLAHIRQPDLLIGAIAAELGIRDLDAGETFERVVERLTGSPALLVLDNLEQIVECGPKVMQLLQRVPNLTILATSRQPLQVQGEFEYPLRPLQTEANNLDESPAEQLFLLRAREASYGFAPTAENRAAIREISARLGGIPLAIELAASWVKVLPPQRLLENFDRQLDVLVRGPRDLPVRQQTMRSAIAWSYQLLDEGERRLFRQLGVFQGRCTLGDIESVAGGVLTAGMQDDPELVTLEALGSLVTKSLVQAADDLLDPAQPEYTMLEIIRAFAMEQLHESAEADAARDRHLQHFAKLAEKWTADLSSEKRDRRLGQLDRDYPNLRAALEWAYDSGQAEAAMRLVSALWVYWDWRGLHAEGARWCDRILAMECVVDAETHSNALYAGAAIAFMQANYPRSLELAESCLAVAEGSGDDRTVGRALIALGNSAYDQGNLDRAEAVYTRSLETIRRIDEPTALQVALVNLGFVRYQQARFEEARALFEESVAQEQQTGRSAAWFWALAGIAQLDVRADRGAEAAERLRWLIDRQRESDSGQLGAALLVFAALERAQGNVAGAQVLARESLSNRVARDERAFITDSLAELGAIALAAGVLDDGVTLTAAVATQRDRLGYGLPDRERILHAELLERARADMETAAFDRAWFRGVRLSLSEAVSYALERDLVVAPATSEPVVSAPAAMLTRREREVLALIVDGRTDREIAHILSISPGTASRHVANILHKLDVRTRSAAAAWAIRNGSI